MRFEKLAPFLDERMRRLVAASESLAIGFGGTSQVSRQTGVSRRAIIRGIKELDEAPSVQGGRVRPQEKPSADERDRLGRYYRRQVEILERAPERVEEMMPFPLEGVNPVGVDHEGAAWVGLSSVLLNLDEFITRE